jgi:hypothetical protein
VLQSEVETARAAMMVAYLALATPAVIVAAYCKSSASKNHTDKDKIIKR